MNDTLAQICEDKRAHVAQRKSVISEEKLWELAKAAEKPRGFKLALTHALDRGDVGLIAEIKKASPSKGVIREDFNPAKLAQAYVDGGATCLSVLTDEPYFQGRDDYLMQARDAVKLPALRKDFMIDPYQIVESRALGADCILLIMAALTDEMATKLETVASALSMDVLVEVHDGEELQRALAINPHNPNKMIGINNRNLKTLAVDIATTEKLAADLSGSMLAVCESGIATPGDIERIRRCGISCFLVGESLMRQPDVTAATRALLGGIS